MTFFPLLAYVVYVSLNCCQSVMLNIVLG